MQVAPAWILAAVPVLLVGCGRRSEAPTAFERQIESIRAGDASSIDVDAPLTQAEWGRLRGLAGLRVLILRRGSAGDDEAEILATLPAIERLVLRGSPLTDAGFRAIAKCATLRDLNVPQAACTADGVGALNAIPGLRSLRLGGERLAGVGVARAAAALPSLRSLHLIDVEIGDEGLSALSGMKGLRNLYLDGAGVSDDAWAKYFQKRLDVHVHVDQAHHDRDPNRDDHGDRDGYRADRKESTRGDPP